MAYATAEEFAVLLGRGEDGLTENERARAELNLELATGEIDNATGQSLQLASQTETLDGPGGRHLILPRWPVTAIDSVTVLDEDDEPTELVYGTDYRWSTNGILTRRRCYWPCRQRSVIVAWTAGHAPIPAVARSICLRLARSGWENPAGKTSERLADWQAAWAVAGIALTTEEINRLGPYSART
ncbi:hypothetical protein Aple_010710 [Acrocarpospora pleiomorpha]|uniref:Uncharacterized protein n=1 Tax=Acrocarpospora pleiomorpha TaxID=90975 RepID=A0A5M3XBY6_9ACTN|nr:hypothetical protein [Acrocarpospora pleiomorpha]GES18176.1 hypothetical protein Aple_010710 [Acrocarpospora pleiomorpha]